MSEVGAKLCFAMTVALPPMPAWRPDRAASCAPTRAAVGMGEVGAKLRFAMMVASPPMPAWRPDDCQGVLLGEGLPPIRGNSGQDA